MGTQKLSYGLPRHSFQKSNYHQHTWNPVDGPERPEHPDRPDGREVELLHVEAVLECAGEGRQVGRGNYWSVFATQNARCQREAKLFHNMRLRGFGCKAKQRIKVQIGLTGRSSMTQGWKQGPVTEV